MKTMNKSIKKELDDLFVEWESRMKEKDSASHFTRDGLMYNSIPDEQNEDIWFSSSKRVLFIIEKMLCIHGRMAARTSR